MCRKTEKKTLEAMFLGTLLLSSLFRFGLIAERKTTFTTPVAPFSHPIYPTHHGVKRQWTIFWMCKWKSKEVILKLHITIAYPHKCVYLSMKRDGKGNIPKKFHIRTYYQAISYALDFPSSSYMYKVTLWAFTFSVLNPLFPFFC